MARSSAGRLHVLTSCLTPVRANTLWWSAKTVNSNTLAATRRPTPEAGASGHGCAAGPGEHAGGEWENRKQQHVGGNGESDPRSGSIREGTWSKQHQVSVEK